VTKRKAWASAGLATLLALSLSACSDRAAQNPNAPGSPGTGNAAEVVRPAAPDGPPGGPSGVAGSLPHTGASGGDVMPGTTGSGTSEIGGRSATAEAGTGLNGGLGNGSASPPMGAGPAGSGSPNNTSGSAVGQR